MPDQKGRITMEDVAKDRISWEAALRNALLRLVSIKQRIEGIAETLESAARLLRNDPTSARFEFSGGIHAYPQATLEDYTSTVGEIEKHAKLLRTVDAGRAVDALFQQYDYKSE